MLGGKDHHRIEWFANNLSTDEKWRGYKGGRRENLQNISPQKCWAEWCPNSNFMWREWELGDTNLPGWPRGFWGIRGHRKPTYGAPAPLPHYFHQKQNVVWKWLGGNQTNQRSCILYAHLRRQVEGADETWQLNIAAYSLRILAQEERGRIWAMGKMQWGCGLSVVWSVLIARASQTYRVVM